VYCIYENFNTCNKAFYYLSCLMSTTALFLQ
jgi:hypothetical protein